MHQFRVFGTLFLRERCVLYPENYFVLTRDDLNGLSDTRERIERVGLKKLVKRLFIHDPTDPISFWRTRAKDSGWSSVMWRNSTYNELADHDQWQAIKRNLPQQRGAVLDLGCGTGRLSARLVQLFDSYIGVDLDTMVAEARRRHPKLAPAFITATVQEYDYPTEKFDMVLSMGCLAAACRAEELPEIARRIVSATRPGGRIIMIDPFHRLPVLARNCRVSPGQVIEIFTSLGSCIEEWSGIHFIPMRLLLTRQIFFRFPGLTSILYKVGEAIGQLSPRYLSDYKVIVLTKR